MAKGWFINIKIKLSVNLNISRIHWIMQEIV